MIEQLKGFPDFGYSVNNITKDETQFNGWSLIKDFMINKGKYERLENYLDANKYKVRLKELYEL